MTQNRKHIIVMEKFIAVTINDNNQIVAKKESGYGVILGDYKNPKKELNDILTAYAENRSVYVMKGEENGKD